MENSGNFYSRWKSSTVNAISFLFIFIFIYAAAGQLLHFENFYLRLGQSPFIGILAEVLVWLVPFLGIAISILFTFSRFKYWAMVTSLILMLIFTIYILAVLNFAPSIPCSCLGVFENLSWDEHLIFNLIFVGLAITGIVILRKRKGSGYQIEK